MTPSLFAFHKMASKLTPSVAHQEKLDTHFTTEGTGKWRSFKKNLRAKSFVAAVQQDDRADERLKRFAARVGEYANSKDPGVPITSDSGKTYRVKYLTEADSFGCNCGHWIHDLSHLSRPGDCKHITQVRASFEKKAYLGTMVGALSAGRRFQDSTIRARITADAAKQHLPQPHILPHPIRALRREIHQGLI